MKKALALILALLMLCSTVTIVASAADEPEVDYWESVTNDLGMNVYIGAPMETSPVLDGVISKDEYSKSVYNEPSDILNYGNKITSGGLTEYFAHDADWVYYAVKYESTSQGVAFMWQYKPGNTFDIFQPSGTDNYFYNRVSWQARYNTGYADKYRYWNTDYTGSWAPKLTNGVSIRAPYIHNNAPTAALEEHHCAAGLEGGYAVFEAKVAKSYFAMAGGCSTEEVVVVPYFTYLHSADGIGTIYTAEQIAALTEAGAKFLPTAGGLGYKFMVLDDDMYHDTGAEEEPEGPQYPADEQLVRDFDLVVDVPFSAKAPTLDGVVTEDDGYTYSRTVAKADMHNGAASSEIQSDVTEYFSHDKNYVYYAATFTQASDNRAFWPQWKSNNSFAVFNSDYNTRATYQARYSWDTEKEAVINYVNGIGADGSNAAPVDGVDVTFKALKDRTTNFKTYEFKFAKSYFAKINGISNSDVKVIPYYVNFHASCTLGGIPTDDFRTAVANANQDPAKLTDATPVYFFMNLLPDETAKLADDLGITVKVQPVAEAPVLDGVISENEYPTTRTLNVADILNGNGGGEIQGETITEYFGHDGEYVYYAATFTQANDNRAFWPQFKCDNTFDIYNSNYNARATYQARYSWGPDANGVDHHINYVNGIGAQAGFDAPVDGVDLSFAALKDRETNVKTYEFKFAKNYFATQNGISYDEVEVIPYYSYFHASCAIAPVFTDEQVQLILDAGKVAPAAGNANYYFMVLEGETTGIEDRIDFTTNETASIRLSPSNAGIRFKSLVNSDDLATFVTKFGAANVKVGTLITLESILGENELVAGADFQVVDVEANVATPFATEAGVTTFAGSLTNLNKNNYAKNFAARGYIAYRADENSEWIYIYSDVVAVRSAAYVANEAIASGKYTDDAAALAILNAYAAAQAN